MANKEKLLEFLKSKKLLVIASHSDKTWISNVFYGIDDNFRIYFVSPKSAEHSQQISRNPDIAFSVVWYNEKNHGDRKGVQGKGTCRLARDDEEIRKGVELHNKNFPEFAGRITFDWIKNNEFNSRIWVIEPKSIKYWDDQLYGDDETEEFEF